MWSSGLSRRLLQGLQGCSDQDTTERQNMESRKPLQRYVHIITDSPLSTCKCMHCLYSLGFMHCVLFCSLVAQVGRAGFMGIDDIQSNCLSSWIESDRMGECDLTVPTCLCYLPKNLTGIRYCSTLGWVRFFVVVVWNFIFIEGKKCTNPIFLNGSALYIKLILYLSTASQLSNDLQLSLFR